MMAAAASSTDGVATGGRPGGEIIALKGGDERGTGCEREEFCMMSPRKSDVEVVYVQ